MASSPEIVQTKDGAALLETFLSEQISAFIQIERAFLTSPIERVSKLHPLFVAVIEDAISIRLLCSDARLNQAYIVSRELLERATNYCFLQICSEEQYNDYLDYSLNKAGRRVDRAIEENGKVQATIYLKDGLLVLPEEIQAAIAKFTSQRGGEKTRWTAVPLQDRAAAIETKIGGTGLFMSLLTIYADASEALHGTLYGALVHLGTYDFGAVPYDQLSLDRLRYSTISALCLMAGGAMGTLLAMLAHVGEPSAGPAASASKKRFRTSAHGAGLAR